ncbi:Vps71p TDEL_0A03750 [Torulaspora delbrueckii]|uniref:HIT-type domain-containing protein n=1 Tax=Torulaspora delbrueckii TaxID=4950 RepID=G8ZM63_TORDE|nr:hypothetical protein TDEL_0A03750 [Torulaspora delbrueckii]CCE89707.1 hypothetical protein TDEL_0A03750 [Torulaspora delbrueckii]
MLVEEINKKTYDPSVYYTSLDSQTSSHARSKVSKSLGSSRSSKRVNYSLADLENKLYTQKQDAADDSNQSRDSTILDKFTQQEIIQSKKRYMELDTENQKELVDVPSLLSAITGINRNKIDTGNSNPSSVRQKNKIEIPKTIHLSYRSTKPPVPKRKNTNRVVALKKTLSSRRPLQSYLETLDQVNKSIIYHNVANKKYFKVLPVITICSVCGGYDSISSCVQCGNKICSLRCFNLHNETRCIHR